MAKKEFDTVVEAVRYGEDGKIQWVRVYKRMGSVFSDRIIWSREELVRHLKNGAKVYAGKRIPLMAGSFEVTEPVRLIEGDGDGFLVTGNARAERDELKAVPVI